MSKALVPSSATAPSLAGPAHDLNGGTNAHNTDPEPHNCLHPICAYSHGNTLPPHLRHKLRCIQDSISKIDLVTHITKQCFGVCQGPETDSRCNYTGSAVCGKRCGHTMGYRHPVSVCSNCGGCTTPVHAAVKNQSGVLAAQILLYTHCSCAPYRDLVTKTIMQAHTHKGPLHGRAARQHVFSSKQQRARRLEARRVSARPSQPTLHHFHFVPQPPTPSTLLTRLTRIRTGQRVIIPAASAQHTDDFGVVTSIPANPAALTATWSILHIDGETSTHSTDDMVTIWKHTKQKLGTNSNHSHRPSAPRQTTLLAQTTPMLPLQAPQTDTFPRTLEESPTVADAPVVEAPSESPTPNDPEVEIVTPLADVIPWPNPQWIIRNVPAQGNCLFEALAYIGNTACNPLSGRRHHTHLTSRALVCTELERHWPLYHLHCDTMDSAFQYTQRMRQLGVWGGAGEVMAFAAVCDIHIRTWLVSPQKGCISLVLDTVRSPQNATLTTLEKLNQAQCHHLFYDGAHYQNLIAACPQPPTRDRMPQILATRTLRPRKSNSTTARLRALNHSSRLDPVHTHTFILADKQITLPAPIVEITTISDMGNVSRRLHNVIFPTNLYSLLAHCKLPTPPYSPTILRAMAQLRALRAHQTIQSSHIPGCTGYGLFTTLPLQPNTYIGMYSGLYLQLLDTSYTSQTLKRYGKKGETWDTTRIVQIKGTTLKRRPTKKNSNPCHATRTQYTILCGSRADPCTYINEPSANEATEANCTLTQEENTTLIYIHTNRFIPAGTELTIHYGPKYWNDSQQTTSRKIF